MLNGLKKLESLKLFLLYNRLGENENNLKNLS